MRLKKKNSKFKYIINGINVETKAKKKYQQEKPLNCDHSEEKNSLFILVHILWLVFLVASPKWTNIRVISNLLKARNSLVQITIYVIVCANLFIYASCVTFIGFRKCVASKQKSNYDQNITRLSSRIHRIATNS